MPRLGSLPKSEYFSCLPWYLAEHDEEPRKPRQSRPYRLHNAKPDPGLPTRVGPPLELSAKVSSESTDGDILSYIDCVVG
ncbi:hypothetical protein IG631_07296 [Alternaria alternata]|nr:hypothetical protein IG631_07296 [Alternaria alternata]